MLHTLSRDTTITTTNNNNIIALTNIAFTFWNKASYFRVHLVLILSTPWRIEGKVNLGGYITNVASSATNPPASHRFTCYFYVTTALFRRLLLTSSPQLLLIPKHPIAISVLHQHQAHTPTHTHTYARTHAQHFPYGVRNQIDISSTPHTSCCGRLKGFRSKNAFISLEHCNPSY